MSDEVAYHSAATHFPEVFFFAYCSLRAQLPLFSFIELEDVLSNRAKMATYYTGRFVLRCNKNKFE